MPGSLAAAKPGRFDPYNLPAAVKSFPLVLHARFATPLPAVLMLQPLRFILRGASLLCAPWPVSLRLAGRPLGSSPHQVSIHALGPQLGSVSAHSLREAPAPHVVRLPVYLHLERNSKQKLELEPIKLWKRDACYFCPMCIAVVISVLKLRGYHSGSKIHPLERGRPEGYVHFLVCLVFAHDAIEPLNQDQSNHQVAWRESSVLINPLDVSVSRYGRRCSVEG
mmetsp:Transcript_28522/g.64687  ORF Transcript_28522/g.64687 Transcript_28522/m.64687 type:complete len:223 (-) Transcript_28522:425-1093(-)